MFVPRYYQSECVNSIYEYFVRNAGNPLCALPTGTGKGVIHALFLKSVFESYPSQKILCLTHVKELIAQNYKKLLELWPEAPAGINSAGLNQRDVHRAIIFAGIASVYRRAEEFGRVDLVLIDEAHLVSPNENSMYQTFLGELKKVNPLLKVIGFTATPWRMGQGKLIDDGLFTDVCYDITGVDAFNKLIDEGYLCPLVPKRTDLQIDIDGVSIRGGDYVQSQLQKAVNKRDLNEAMIREFMELSYDRKCKLIFASGVDHAIELADILSAAGQDCAAVHSRMEDNERDLILEKFKNGSLETLVNYNMMTTGHDIPRLDAIGIGRHTVSPGLWVQMLGRGTRPFEGKRDCLVLDFAGNTAKLGPINDPVLPQKARKGGGGQAPVRLCDNCNSWNHASKRKCDYCGHEFPVVSKLNPNASTAELIKTPLPQVEVIDVGHIVYSRHKKAGRPDSMRVDYYAVDGFSKFSEFIAFEYGGKVAERAKMWWSERDVLSLPPPQNTTEALEESDRLRVPISLRIWINKAYPEILACCFDGTKFGTVSERNLKVTKETRNGSLNRSRNAPF